MALAIFCDSTDSRPAQALLPTRASHSSSGKWAATCLEGAGLEVRHQRAGRGERQAASEAGRGTCRGTADIAMRWLAARGARLAAAQPQGRAERACADRRGLDRKTIGENSAGPFRLDTKAMGLSKEPENKAREVALEQAGSASSVMESSLASLCPSDYDCRIRLYVFHCSCGV